MLWKLKRRPRTEPRGALAIMGWEERRSLRRGLDPATFPYFPNTLQDPPGPSRTRERGGGSNARDGGVGDEAPKSFTSAESFEEGRGRLHSHLPVLSPESPA